MFQFVFRYHGRDFFVITFTFLLVAFLQAVASGGDGNGGDSKMLFSELQSLQKEYRDLSDRYRALQLSGPSSGGASVRTTFMMAPLASVSQGVSHVILSLIGVYLCQVNEASSERLTRHSSRK